MMTMHERALRGMPFSGILLIDGHCHLGFSSGYYIPDGSPQALLDMMNHLGVDTACLSHFAGFASDYKWGNDRVIEAVRNYPDRFKGYCTINPFYPEEIPYELERCFQYEGIIGIKLHPWHQERTMAYKNFEPVYRYAAEKECIVLVHTYSWEEVLNIDRFASEYPGVVFIMAHTGGEINVVERAVDIINRRDNVYTDLAVSESREGNVEWLVSEIGAKKLLYGTDMPCMDPRATLARVAMARISEEEKLDIFGRNMQRILNKLKR